MRPIKFRGKSKETGKLVEGCLLVFESDEVSIAPSGSDVSFWKDGTITSTKIDVIPETVGQYTGLKDCEGREIYEGDILQINIYSCVVNKIIASGKAAVGYRGCAFGVEWGFSRDFSGLHSFGNHCTLEVIGNAWDNPDLLER